MATWSWNPWLDANMARAASEQLAERVDELEREVKQLTAKWARARQDVAEHVTALAYEKNQNLLLQTSLSDLRMTFRGLEQKMKDVNEPPISSEDLDKMLKGRSILQAENKALREQVERLNKFLSGDTKIAN